MGMLFRALLPALTLALFTPLHAAADYVNLTGAENARNIAEIHVENDRVRVALEVFVEDLDKFLELIPDDFFEGSDVKPPPVAERMRVFSEEGIRIDADGSIVTGTLTGRVPSLHLTGRLYTELVGGPFVDRPA